MLDDALNAVRAEGRRRVVLVGGEPGIGKTALTAELAGSARRDGAVALYGRCDEDLGIPYQPWIEALAHLVRHASEPLLTAHVAARGGVLVRLVPELGHRVNATPHASSDPEGERYLVFGAVVDLLERVSNAVPVVLVFDDLHWPDLPSLQLLHYVVGADAALRLLVTATYRDSDIADSGPLAATLASLHREPGIERIELLEGIGGHEMGDDGIELAQLVRWETGGNPFFAAEVLRHLAESGVIRQEDERWAAKVDFSAIGLPESVREVVDQRVRRLGDDAHRTLTLASVIGREFDLGLLARATERDEDAVLDTLDEAAAVAVVAEVAGRSDRFTFTHALFQHTLYDELSASRRGRAHRRIDELLEAELGDGPGDRIGELAYHWISAATPADAGKAAGYAHRAGTRALDALAPAEAIRWFRQAVEILDSEPDHDAHQRLEVVIGLGRAHLQRGPRSPPGPGGRRGVDGPPPRGRRRARACSQPDVRSRLGARRFRPDCRGVRGGADARRSDRRSGRTIRAAQNRLIAMASSADRAGIASAMELMEPDSLTVYGANLLNIRWHQGRTEEMLPLIEQAAAENPDIPAFRAVYAQTLCECGRIEEARPLLETARSEDFHHAAYDHIWLTNTSFWGDTAA